MDGQTRILDTVVVLSCFSTVKLMQEANWLVDIWGFQQLQHGRHISAFSHIQSCHFTKTPIGAGGTDFGRLAAGAFNADILDSGQT